ncbi:MAG: tRNA uridine-5-carboxymethylaminomethyl(34) synthesis GTPase MnmE, partial [Gammaproteobacteria bacterium]
MHPTDDTIAAIATAPGRGGIGVVRLTGKSVPDLAKQLLGFLPEARSAKLLRIKDKKGQNIDEALVIYFPAPRSFTGEHVLEIQAHGGPVVLDMLLARVLEFGARQARPGEFSERAFLNDKLDLAQAEAIADLIDSSTQQSARAAMRSLQGEFSNQVQALLDQLIALRVFVEAAIDFPEEEIDFLSDGKVQLKLQDIDATFINLFNKTRQGCL